MRILFCNIAWMKYYRGTFDGDIPVNGGSWVDEHHTANEDLNFWPITVTTDDTNEQEEMLLGSFETKSTNGQTPNQVHIEKIEGCSDLKKEDYVDGMLVIWCATSPKGESKVVGWYKNATVYRYYESIEIEEDTGEQFERGFNIKALADDAVLLPETERNRNIWRAPRNNRKHGTPYGFFRSNVWYPKETEAQDFVTRLVANINSYQGENVMKSEIT